MAMDMHDAEVELSSLIAGTRDLVIDIEQQPHTTYGLASLGAAHRQLLAALDALTPHLHARMIEARKRGATLLEITQASGYGSLTTTRNITDPKAKAAHAARAAGNPPASTTRRNSAAVRPSANSAPRAGAK